MTTQNKQPSPQEVAKAVARFMQKRFGEVANSPNALEGMWLAMQLVGSPRRAAETIGYCTIKVD
jgi:hypothetical protein